MLSDDLPSVITAKPFRLKSIAKIFRLIKQINLFLLRGRISDRVAGVTKKAVGHQGVHCTLLVPVSW